MAQSKQLPFQPTKTICIGEAEKLLGTFVVDALQQNFDALKDWAQSAPITINKVTDGRPVVLIENREVERAYTILQTLGVPRERAKNVANGIMVLDARYCREIGFLEMANADLLALVKEYASKGGESAKQYLTNLEKATFQVVTPA